MPNYRSNQKSYRRKPAKRAPYKNKKKDNMKRMLGHVANKALDYAKLVPGPVGTLARGLGMMKSFINVEEKYVDTILATSTIPSTPATISLLLNAIAQGDGYNQRNGQSVINKSVTINYALTMNSVAVFTSIKIALVMDKKPDVTALTTAATVYGAASNYLSQVDKEENGDRYVILKSEIINLDSAYRRTYFNKWHVDLTETHTLWDGTTGAIADFEKNALFIVAVSDQPTNLPVLDVNARFRYFDN